MEVILYLCGCLFVASIVLYLSKQKMNMEVIAIILAAMIGFAAGMYLVTQISDWIDKNSNQQYMKQTMNGIYIAMTLLAIGFIVYANYISNNQHKKKVEVNLEPISQPVDAVMDSIDWECGEQHGVV